MNGLAEDAHGRHHWVAGAYTDPYANRSVLVKGCNRRERLLDRERALQCAGRGRKARDEIVTVLSNGNAPTLVKGVLDNACVLVRSVPACQPGWVLDLRTEDRAKGDVLVDFVVRRYANPTQEALHRLPVDLDDVGW
jgi:hypothetical protein